MRDKHRDPEWCRALEWWSAWHKAAMQYAYRYMCCPHKRRSRVAQSYRRRFKRCRERMLAASDRVDAREQELRQQCVT